PKHGAHLGAEAATSNRTISAVNLGVAAFGQVGFRLSNGLEFQAGLRYDYEHAALDARSEFQPDGGELLVQQPDTSASADFHALSPSFSVKYTFNEGSQVYGSLTRGFRTGGISQVSSEPAEASVRAFDREYSASVGVGAR